MKKYIMTLDQGTTSSRCILFDKKGKICALSQKEFEQIYPKPGWVEHNPKEILSTQLGVLIEAAAQLGADPEAIAAIGITNQRETTIVWDKNTGEPVYNAIVWQCRRTAPIIDKIPKDMAEKIRKKTGLIPDAYFSASKIKWILDNVRGARKKAEKGQLLFGTVDTWLMWNLSEGQIHATDYSNASRTMLFDIHKLKWDKELLDYFNIPESMLPEVHPSGYMYGYTGTSYFKKKIPICGVAGDQQSSLFGTCCFDPGESKNTYGTGCFLLMNTGKKAVQSKNGLLTTMAATMDGEVQYVLEGSVFVGGAAVKWLRDELHIVNSASETEALAASVEDTQGGYLVPAFTGLGAPHWKQDARGVMVGITRGFGRSHFVRATLESIAYQTLDIIRAMEADSKTKLLSLKVDGGASANNFLMQFQSDIVDCMVERPKMIENTALGAAYLAGLTVGYWKSKEELKQNIKPDRVFTPTMDSKTRKELVKGWERAVETAKNW